MANIEVETIGSSLLKKFNATGSVWENDPWVHQILLPGRDDCSFFEAGDLEFAERPVSLYAFGKNLEGAPFNAIMADEYISKLKKTLELIEEHSPLGLEHFDHIIYSAEQIINGYTKTPANAVYLQDFERYTPEKPFGSLNDTAVLFPAVLSSGAFRGEISEMTHIFCQNRLKREYHEMS